MMDGIFLLLGTNIGDRQNHLIEAQELIKSDIGDILRMSSVYRTEPWGNSNQAWFLNQALEVATELHPLSLIQTIHRIESQMGRVRREKWGERLIDIDILYYNNEILGGPDLVIPHPAIASRRFTLLPMTELSPKFRHPVLNKTQEDLLQECEDPLQVELHSTEELAN